MRFVSAGYGRYLNLEHVTSIRLGRDGIWRAQVKDDENAEIGMGDYAERLLDMLAGTIIPALPDEVMDVFWLSEQRRLIHEKKRIIAWAVGPSAPTPITIDGPREFGFDESRKEIRATRRVDGSYDDIINGVYQDDDQVRKELENLCPAAEAAE
jgi:hypothetical protein